MPTFYSNPSFQILCILALLNLFLMIWDMYETYKYVDNKKKIKAKNFTHEFRSVAKTYTVINFIITNLVFVCALFGLYYLLEHKKSMILSWNLVILAPLITIISYLSFICLYLKEKIKLKKKCNNLNFEDINNEYEIINVL